MNNERKILYVSASVNFVLGIVMGIILFYGQMRTSSIGETVYSYDKSATLSDFIRLSWINLIWMFSVVAAHAIFPVSVMHPVLIVRGCVTSFSILYIAHFLGIKEAVASILPQCLSVLPLLGLFSVENAFKHKNNIKNGHETFSIKRNEVILVLILSMLAAGAEVIIFRALCKYLF